MSQVIEIWQPSTNINIDYSSYQASVNEAYNYTWQSEHIFNNPINIINSINFDASGTATSTTNYDSYKLNFDASIWQTSEINGNFQGPIIGFPNPNTTAPYGTITATISVDGTVAATLTVDFDGTSSGNTTYSLPSGTHTLKINYNVVYNDGTTYNNNSSTYTNNFVSSTQNFTLTQSGNSYISIFITAYYTLASGSPKNITQSIYLNGSNQLVLGDNAVITANNTLDDGAGNIEGVSNLKIFTSGTYNTSSFPTHYILNEGIGAVYMIHDTNNTDAYFMRDTYSTLQLGHYDISTGALNYYFGISASGVISSLTNTSTGWNGTAPTSRNIFDDGSGGFSFASGGSINGGLVIENGNTIRITNSNNSSQGIQYFQSAYNTVWAQIGFREMAVTDVLDIHDGNFNNYALAIAGNSTSYSLNTTEITSVGTLHSGSDKRLKPDFQVYDSNVLEELKRVEFGQYSQWFNPVRESKITQDHMKASVNALTLPDKVRGDSEDGYAGIRFPDVDAWLIGIAQELLKRIEKLEKIIETGNEIK